MVNGCMPVKSRRNEEGGLKWQNASVVVLDEVLVR